MAKFILLVIFLAVSSAIQSVKTCETQESEEEMKLFREWGYALNIDVIKRGQELEKEYKTLEEVHATTKPAGLGSTFLVDDVEISREKLPPTSAVKSVVSRLNQKVESCFHSNANIVSRGDFHGLVGAVHEAYHNHYPLVLSPDMIWLGIMQGLSTHINENSDKLRKKFVEHEGKKEIKVRRDDFVKGSATNPWPEVFSEFSGKIKDEIGEKTYSLITPDFTTTGPLEKAVTDIVLMEAMQSFFDYTLLTLCGIPSITLQGTTEDWVAIRDKTAKLEQYDLKWWTDHLLPVLDQFVNASKGEVDRSFWSSIYKYHQQTSGTPMVTGWIATLFPYDSDNRQNTVLGEWSNHKGVTLGLDDAMTTDDFPTGLSAAPFIWEYFDEEFKMKFIGGFMGYSQDSESLVLRPELGWAVVENTNV
ncbi:uncharacterized protein LOC144446589 [Glandiceps talaboti]